MYRIDELEWLLSLERAAELQRVMSHIPATQDDNWLQCMARCLFTQSVMRLDNLSLPVRFVKRYWDLVHCNYPGLDRRDTFYYAILYLCKNEARLST